MSLDKVFEEYGRAVIALEIAQGQFNQTKQKLIEALKKEEEDAKVRGDKTPT